MRGLRAWAAAGATALSLVPLAAPGTAAARPAPRPDLRADAAILVDAATGKVLLAKRPDARRAIASTTKLMTALLTLERARPRDVLVAPPYRAMAVESKIGLRPGERMTVRDLLHALLLESANDAAVDLARNIAGSRAAFVDDMNRRAAELGLRGTRFANPIGLDDPDNYSTARDLATLARKLMANRRFARIVNRPRAVLSSGRRRRVVENRNALVTRHSFVKGVKTGHTDRAGYVLVGAGSRRGAQVISVVLGEPGPPERDADTLALLRYGLAQFRRVRALVQGRPVARVRVKGRGGRRAALTVPAGVAVWVLRGERPATRVRAPAELEGPLPAGRRVGTVEVVYRGRVVRRAPLVTASAVPEASTARKVWSALDAVAIAVALLLAGTVVLLTGLRARANRLRRARRASRR